MKWIGQHIYDLVSRFREDIYLEDLSTTTDTNVLVVDSNGKVSKSTTLAGDITGVDLYTDAGVAVQYQLGDATIKVLSSGDAISTSWDGTQGAIIVEGEDATTSAKGVASFNTNNFSISSGAVSLSNTITYTPTAHNVAGTSASIGAGSTTAGTTNNIAGGSLTIHGGQGKGSGAGGDIVFRTANAGSSGSTLNSLATALTISDDLSATFAGTITGNLTGDVLGNVEGNVTGDVTGNVGGNLTGTVLTATQASITSTANLVTVGTIGTGVWNGTKITDIYTNASGKRYGSTIKILPSDFMINDDAASPLSFKDGSNSGVHVNDAANEVIAFVTIPEGMKATLVDVYGTHNKTLKVWAPDLNASFDFTGTTLGTGAMNTQLDITDTNATATNYLAIQVTLTATSQRIWGGVVTIAPQ
mgnify:CR=1 FL=1